MTYQEQRELAARLFPELAAVITDEDNCFDAILKAAKPYRKRILELWSREWPQEWAYWWATYIGDRDHMRQFVTEAQWAYEWACDIGDRDHMRQFVTEAKWAYHWARFIGDRDHMRRFVVGTVWEWEIEFN